MLTEIQNISFAAFVLCLIAVLGPTSIVQAEGVRLGEGEVLGTLGKIACNTLDDASVKLQLTKNGRALSLKRAKEIQRTNRKILNLLKKKLNAVKLVTGNIGRSNTSFHRATDEETYSDLRTKQKKKLSNVLNQLRKLDISNTEFEPETPLDDVETEIEALKILIEEQRDLLDQASIAIRKCKGCAEDVIENIGRARAFNGRPSELEANTRGKKKSTETCSCYTRSLEATYRFFAENNPENENQCNAPIYAQFQELENENRAVSWTVYYTFADQEFTKVGIAPDFDDTDDLGFVYQVPSGSHWVRLGSSGIDGAGPADCSSLKETAESVYMEPLSVDVEICPLGQ
ncbi:MAG: hypothetical protein KDD64_06615 [Bdellovibrionales bacterium]|nr:hypothetical protein [Bdellovibrionales bacterium]